MVRNVSNVACARSIITSVALCCKNAKMPMSTVNNKKWWEKCLKPYLNVVCAWSIIIFIMFQLSILHADVTNNLKMVRRMFKGLFKCRLCMKYDHVYALCCKNEKMPISSSKEGNSEYRRSWNIIYSTFSYCAQTYTINLKIVR